jgi:hypothetical protein
MCSDLLKLFIFANLLRKNDPLTVLMEIGEMVDRGEVVLA